MIWTEAVAGHFTTPAGTDVRTEIAGRTSTGAWFLMSFDTIDSTWKNSRMGRWSDKVLWSDAIVGDGGTFASTKLGSWSTAQAWSDVQVGDFLGNGFSGVAGRFDPTDTGAHKKTGLMARALAGEWVRSLSNSTAFTTTTPTGYP